MIYGKTAKENMTLNKRYMLCLCSFGSFTCYAFRLFFSVLFYTL